MMADRNRRGHCLTPDCQRRAAPGSSPDQATQPSHPASVESFIIHSFVQYICLHPPTSHSSSSSSLSISFPVIHFLSVSLSLKNAPVPRLIKLPVSSFRPTFCDLTALDFVPPKQHLSSNAIVLNTIVLTPTDRPSSWV